MSAIKTKVVVVGLLLAATPAGAMTGLDFLHHNVPDWGYLAVLTRALILERGYRDKDIAEIAREAAIANGMAK